MYQRRSQGDGITRPISLVIFALIMIPLPDLYPATKLYQKVLTDECVGNWEI